MKTCMFVCFHVSRHTTYPEQVKRMGHSMDQATLGTLYLPRASQEDGTLNGPSYARHTILTQSKSRGWDTQWTKLR